LGYRSNDLARANLTSFHPRCSLVFGRLAVPPYSGGNPLRSVVNKRGESRDSRASYFGYGETFAQMMYAVSVHEMPAFGFLPRTIQLWSESGKPVIVVRSYPELASWPSPTTFFG
jgi:hypothetical protein